MGSATRPLKVVSIMEASSVTGPAKNLLEFAQRSRETQNGLRPVHLTVVAYQRGSEPENAFIQAARRAGIPVDIIHETGRFDRNVTGRLREIVRERDPDIIQTHNIKSHFFLRLSGIWRTTPWIAFHHGFTREDVRMRLYNVTSRWSMRAAHQMVTVCRPFVEQLVARGVKRENILIRPNAVRAFTPPDRADVAAARAGIPAPPGALLLVAVGRLSQEKGHADLLEAFAKLPASSIPRHLVLVGEGGERVALEKQRARLNLDRQVTLVGLKSDVRPYYALADVFVLPSHSEGSPNVLLEAMAAGCAIVATSVGGVPETATAEETALLVPPRNPEMMARGIARLLDQPDLRRKLGERARQVAETKFSPEQYCRLMIECYRQVLGTP